jgi:hypothetical protein
MGPDYLLAMRQLQWVWFKLYLDFLTNLGRMRP